MRTLVAASSGKSGSSSSTLLLLAVVVVLGVLFFMSNRRKRRQSQQQQQSLQIGSPVSTTSGMLGTLVRLDDRTATVQVSPGVEMEFIRRAVVPRSALLPDLPADAAGGEPATTGGAFSLEKDSSDGWGADTTGAAGDDRNDPRAEA